MFPISDTIKSEKFPLITIFLIAANIYVFFQEITSGNPDAFIFQYSLIPQAVNFFNPLSLSPFVTSIFLHGGFLHIVSNMWFLWIFGDNVEARLGKIKYIILYLAAGIIGNAIQFLLNPSSPIPMLGASGAVSGVLGAYFLLFPGANVKTLVILFFFITITEIRAVIYIFYWFILQIISGAASLPFSANQGGIAFWAHVGGFVAGLLLAGILRNRNGQDIIEGEIVK